MIGTRDYHPEWGNPVTKEHSWYVLTDNKWTPVKELEKGLKELKDTATQWEEQNKQLPKPTTASRDENSNQWVHEIPRQMDGTWSYHHEWGNPVTKEHAWYVLTDKRILAQKARNTQETIHRTYEAQREGRPKGGCLGPS